MLDGQHELPLPTGSHDVTVDELRPVAIGLSGRSQRIDQQDDARGIARVVPVECRGHMERVQRRDEVGRNQNIRCCFRQLLLRLATLRNHPGLVPLLSEVISGLSDRT